MISPSRTAKRLIPGRQGKHAIRPRMDVQRGGRRMNAGRRRARDPINSEGYRSVRERISALTFGKSRTRFSVEIQLPPIIARVLCGVGRSDDEVFQLPMAIGAQRCVLSDRPRRSTFAEESHPLRTTSFPPFHARGDTIDGNVMVSGAAGALVPFLRTLLLNTVIGVQARFAV